MAGGQNAEQFHAGACSEILSASPRSRCRISSGGTRVGSEKSTGSWANRLIMPCRSNCFLIREIVRGSDTCFAGAGGR